MTGKEKIQAVIDEIDTEFEALVAGKMVRIASGTLERKGLSIDEQKQVLDILANDKKAIRYKAKENYQSADDLTPEDRVDVMEVASMTGQPEYIILEQLLESLTYEVEVLDEFTALIPERDSPEIKYQKNLHLLRLLYNRVIVILDTMVAAGVLTEDDKLNYVYIHLSVFIEDLLDKPSLSKLKSKTPELYTTLMGNLPEIGEGWEYLRKEVMHFYALIEREWILQKSPEFELDHKYIEIFEQIDDAVKSHELLTKQATQKFHQHTEKLTKQIRAQLGNTHTEPEQKAEVKRPSPERVEVHKLEPPHYSSRTGVLIISPNLKVAIAKKGSTKRQDGTKYDQCWLLECLFRNVNSLKLGVNFSTVLGVNKAKIDKKAIKKIRNTVDEINQKVLDNGGPKSLIKMQNGTVFVNSSYL